MACISISPTGFTRVEDTSHYIATTTTKKHHSPSSSRAMNNKRDTCEKLPFWSFEKRDINTPRDMTLLGSLKRKIFFWLTAQIAIVDIVTRRYIVVIRQGSVHIHANFNAWIWWGNFLPSSFFISHFFFSNWHIIHAAIMMFSLCPVSFWRKNPWYKKCQISLYRGY